MPHLLTPISTLRLSGDDTKRFLQTQVTCDIRALTEQPILTACCNHQGRVVANFYIWRTPEDIIEIQLPTPMRQALIDHFTTYLFNSDMTLTEIEAPQLAEAESALWIYPQTSGLWLPQLIGLKQHGGISFHKGCYLGQEIINRTERKGTLKSQCYRLTAASGNALAIGAVIVDEKEQCVGHILAKEKTLGYVAVLKERAISGPLYCKPNQTEQATLSVESLFFGTAVS
jgi:folate-binding protein YgfZ